MKSHYLAALAALPIGTASAAMVELDDSALADVSGQAWVIDYPNVQIRIADLSDRDLSLGPIPISDLIGALEGRFPAITTRFREQLLNSLVFSVSLAGGVLRSVVPVLGRLPDAHVRFEATTPSVAP